MYQKVILSIIETFFMYIDKYIDAILDVNSFHHYVFLFGVFAPLTMKFYKWLLNILLEHKDEMRWRR